MKIDEAIRTPDLEAVRAALSPKPTPKQLDDAPKADATATERDKVSNG